MDYSFYNCNHLKEIPDRLPSNLISSNFTFMYNSCLTNINPELFIDCNNLISMKGTFRKSGIRNFPILPNNVENIDNIFYECYNVSGELKILSKNIKSAKSFISLNRKINEIKISLPKDSLTEKTIINELSLFKNIDIYINRF